MPTAVPSARLLPARRPPMSTTWKTGSAKSGTIVGQRLLPMGMIPLAGGCGRRWGANRRYFVYSEEGLVAELDASGAVVQSYGYVPQSTYGNAPIYTHTSAGYAYYQLDHLGTPQVFTDKSGRIVWQGRARAFGETAEIVNAISNPLRFPGQYEDGETGLFYNYFRYYDAEIGRYVASDPIDIDGGQNTYLYSTLNPVNKFDSFGNDVYPSPTDDDSYSWFADCEKCMKQIASKWDPVPANDKYKHCMVGAEGAGFCGKCVRGWLLLVKN